MNKIKFKTPRMASRLAREGRAKLSLGQLECRGRRNAVIIAVQVLKKLNLKKLDWHGRPNTSGIALQMYSQLLCYVI